ncbi:MAG: amino acid permease [Oscillospiraceae bacterium]|nr:amino acid permease [Oscillospiraceae bacterium]
MIVFLAPWAFAGFESISHSTEEFKFQPKRTLRIMTIAIATASAAYILLTLIGAAALPEGCESWVDYIGRLGQYKGLQGMPVFYGIYAAAGTPGLVILGVTAAAAIITGLVGNTIAASRMIYAMARKTCSRRPWRRSTATAPRRTRSCFCFSSPCRSRFWDARRSAGSWT